MVARRTWPTTLLSAHSFRLATAGGMENVSTLACYLFDCAMTIVEHVVSWCTQPFPPLNCSSTLRQSQRQQLASFAGGAGAGRFCGWRRLRKYIPVFVGERKVPFCMSDGTVSPAEPITTFHPSIVGFWNAFLADAFVLLLFCSLDQTRRAFHTLASHQ